MENIIKLLRSIEKIILEDKEAAKEIAISQAELLKAIKVLTDYKNNLCKCAKPDLHNLASNLCWRCSKYTY